MLSFTTFYKSFFQIKKRTTEKSVVRFILQISHTYSINYTTAITSISISTSLGNLATSTAERAGGFSVKYSA